MSRQANFDKKGKYVFKKSDKSVNSAEDLIKLYSKWCAQYPIVSIERTGGRRLGQLGHAHSRAGPQVQLVGDDLFVTSRAARADGHGGRQRVLVKVNQIGTLSETLDTIAMASKASYGVDLASLGESEDTLIADLAVATNVSESKPDRCRARIAWPNTISFFASAKTLGADDIVSGRSVSKQTMTW
jgi:enolase